MTYCLGIKVRGGLVAIADTRITSGSETTTAKKVSIHKSGNKNLFIMTSGLRSIRDKAVTYFEELLESENFAFDKMYKAANAFGDQLRRVAKEDKQSLSESGLFFNLHTIVGGQLENDEEHKLYLLYPEGNWIEIGEATPFTIIGNSGYGKPILNRAVTFDSSIVFALKTGFLSFDSTRVSANDVGYPIDVVVYIKDAKKILEHRFTEEETGHIGELWGQRLTNIIHEIPDEWAQKLVEETEQILLRQQQQKQKQKQDQQQQQQQQ